MSNVHLIKINFKGGLISIGVLLHILEAASLAGIQEISFGLRQVLWMRVQHGSDGLEKCLSHLKEHKVFFELDADEHLNIISSYPAQEVFTQRGWLSEGIYKDIFDSFTHAPRLKVNIADAEQSFTPMTTGHINWIASKQTNYWYLLIRMPNTNNIHIWDRWVDTSDVARMSKEIEKNMIGHAGLLTNNINGFFDRLTATQAFNTMPATEELTFPAFMLPYYEGLNRYQDKLWLGIYRRNEAFSVAFLQDVCQLCFTTQIGLICATSWKSIIIKNIEHEDRKHWNALLAKHQINVRHAANELNFQVEDHDSEALALKNELVQHLSSSDTRTFGVCVGIKLHEVGEVFCSVLIVRRRIRGIFFQRDAYDILLAEDFNPNKRTNEVFAKNLGRGDLAQSLRGAILKYYVHQQMTTVAENSVEASMQNHFIGKQVPQCPNCLTIYDVALGRPDLNISTNTSFDGLPNDYQCECCETPKKQFVWVDEGELFATS